MNKDTRPLRKVIHIDENTINNHLDQTVRDSVEETINYRESIRRTTRNPWLELLSFGGSLQLSVPSPPGRTDHVRSYRAHWRAPEFDRKVTAPGVNPRSFGPSLQVDYNDFVAGNWTLKFGTLADGQRFIRESVRSTSPDQGLAALEEMRRAHYDDPENPPGLERVFILYSGPRREICGCGSVRSGNAG
jgi:hypothetical protein